MVGSHTILSTYNKPDSNLSFLKHENWYILDTIYENDNILLALSHYEGYPYKKWTNNKFVILFEGMIYNLSEDIIEEEIIRIAEIFVSGQRYTSYLNSFIEKTDGDFIIQIYDLKNYKYILFNDYLGRLPLYYYLSDNITLISRETKFLLEYIPEILLNKVDIAEFLMLGYNLGDKTIFKNIKKLKPCEFLFWEFKGKPKATTGITGKFGFDLKGRFYAKEKSLRKLKDTFLKATQDRVNKLHEKGYEIISDLSGGFDSRTLIGSLSKFDKNITYFTYEYIQDESLIAKELFNILDKPGKHLKSRFKNVVDYEKVSSLVYKTDGLVNYYTTSICYNDSKYIKNQSAPKIGHFAGFGGEFLRHPERKFIKSIKWGFFNGLYTYLLPIEACSMINLGYNEFIKKEDVYFKYYKLLTKDAQLKYFYYEYYRNHVGWAGEERGRIFNWYVQPLWSKDFIKIIFQRVPLKWTGFKYFIRFMSLIDQRLLQVPIFRNEIDLKSVKSIKDFEKNFKKGSIIKFYLYRTVVNSFPCLLDAFKKLKTQNNELSVNNNEEAIKLFYIYYHRLRKCHSMFNLKEVEKYIHKTGGEYNRLTTVVMYLYEIEERYLNKIIINA